MPPWDDGNYGYVDDGEEPQSDGSDDGEYVDGEEAENAIANDGGGGGGGSGAPTTTGLKTVPDGRNHIRHEPDEEDDELMMYAKVRFFIIFPPMVLLASLTPSCRITLRQSVLYTRTFLNGLVPQEHRRRHSTGPSSD